MERRRTGTFGWILLALGCLGLVLSLPRLRTFARSPTEIDALIVVEMVTALAAKIGLIVGGLLLLKRRRLASLAITLTLVASVVNSVILVPYVLLGPVPDHLSSAGKVGRYVGRWAALVVPPVFYVYLLVYLRRPGVRAEPAKPGSQGSEEI